MKLRTSPGRQRGYILALNIAVLALMFVGVSYMGQRISLATRLAQTEKLRVDVEYRIESAKSKLMLILATVPRSRRGLGTDDSAIALDGRYYRIDKNILVSLQDIRGLVALNGLSLGGQDRERIERLLGTYGVLPDKAAMLTDTLLDYRDSDDLKRLNGAEKEEYRHAGGNRQIRNGDLLGTSELSRILGWADVAEIWPEDDPITRHVSTQRQTSFNPNTADWRALVAMSRIPEELARSLVASRRSGQTTDISGMIYAGGLGDPFGANGLVNLFPGQAVIVTLRQENLNWGYRMLVTHTPELEASPWRIESVERIALEKQEENPNKIPELPPLSQLRDVSKPLQVQLPF